MIAMEAVDLRYDEAEPWVLREVDLQVAEGQFVSVLGPSGCGKSSLLRLIAGLLEPTSGTVTIQGLAARAFRRQVHRVAFVFQEPRLLPWRNVEQNICLPLELLGLDRDTRRQRHQRALQLIGLSTADARKYPSMLSGGMRMRVALARALVTEPAILLLDEPFAALDDLLRQQLNEELLRIWKQTSTTVLFVTHNIAEATFLSQQVVLMGHSPGRVRDQVGIEFSYPRDRQLRASLEFAQRTGKIADRMQGDGA